MEQVLSGQGKLYVQDRYIASVTYRIIISQPVEIMRSHTRVEAIPGPLEITGEVTLTSPETDLRDFPFGTIFTLQLADGRRWRCIPTNGRLGAATYHMQNAPADDSGTDLSASLMGRLNR
jgi:hypothetical protein